MIDHSVEIIALGTDFWESHPVKDLTSTALVSERRIRKESNLRIERVQYTLATKSLQREAKQYPHKLATFNAGEIFLEELRELLDLTMEEKSFSPFVTSARPSATFFPPFLIRDHVDNMNNLIDLTGLKNNKLLNDRIGFLVQLLDQYKKTAFGIVEVIEPHSVTFSREKLERDKLAWEKSFKKTSAPSITSINLTDQGDLEEKLFQKIHLATKKIQEINFSNWSHITITKALHKCIYETPELDSKKIRVVYGDGSESEEFVFILRKKNDNNSTDSKVSEVPILKASLLSMRHLDQDEVVDMAWFINQQASKPRSYGDAEKICFDITLDQLSQLNKPSQVILFQTGLQPAIVGFYRALLQWLNSNESPQLRVIPKFFDPRTGNYSDGEHWV